MQADIEAVAAQGCHAASVITALTDQDSRDAYAVTATDSETVRQHMERIFADMPVAAVKIGLLGNAAMARAVSACLDGHAGTPVVLDPVIRAGGGSELADRALIQALCDTLMPLATVATPNAYEMRRLAPEADTPDDQAATLQRLGVEYLLVTGGDEPGEQVENRLYADGSLLRCFQWPRLPHAYHGSGCTLSAALAALLARGHALPEAIAQAQRYTWQCLEQAHRPGRGQHIPRRLAGVRLE